MYFANFTFGGAASLASGYVVDPEKCIGCASCLPVCPQGCITMENGSALIEQAHCLHCGRCAEVCPAGAIERR